MRVITTVLIFLLVLAAGCSPTAPAAEQKEPGPSASSPQVDGAAAPEVKEPVASQQAQDLPELTGETEARLRDSFLPGNKIAVSDALKTMKRGDLYVFGVFVKNIMNSPDDFLLTIEFDGLRDSYNNKISGDPALVEHMLLVKSFEPVNIDAIGEHIFSIPVAVPEDARAGRYVFNVVVTNREGGLVINERYDESSINLRVS